MATMADLEAKVHQESDAEDAIILLLQGIKQQLADAIASQDPTAVQKVADALDANIAKLAAATVAGTPAA